MRELIGKLGKTEWTLLNICWEKGPKTTAKEIHEETLKQKYRSYVTVKTMLDRLVDKDFLTKEKFGPVYLYSPNVSKQKVIKNAVGDFLTTVMNQDRVLLLRNLLDSDMDPDEYEEIKALLGNFCQD